MGVSTQNRVVIIDQLSQFKTKYSIRDDSQNGQICNILIINRFIVGYQFSITHAN
jgi:hypothetical protein